MRLYRACWIGLLLALASGMARACSCAGERPACQSLGEAAAIFIGRVAASSEEFFSVQPGFQARRKRVTFEVLESFRGSGELKLSVVTGIGRGDCGYLFKAGETYLVYAYVSGDSGILETNICTRTAPVDGAKDDLTFLRSLASKGPEGRIFGYVTTAPRIKWQPYSGEGAIAGTPVWLESNRGKQQAVTNSKGEYEFGNLLPGDYRLWVDMPGKLGGGERRDLVLRRQACLLAPFIARELGSISGVIRDAAGQPVKHMWVELLRASDRKWTGDEDGFTDEDGHYRIERIPQGAYVMGVHVRHPPNGSKYLWMPYERSYYPGVRDVERACVVKVESAEAFMGVDWKLGPALQQRQIRGVVLGPDEKPASPVFIELKVEGYEDNADLAESKPDGTFTLLGLDRIQYFVQASSGWREGSEPWHCHRVAVPRGDEPLVIKLDRPGKDCDECRRKK